MRIGYIILCRFNSSRLPGKILRKIQGKPILEILLERLMPLGKENIIIATSEESTDDIIAEYCKVNSINIFRGDLNDVAGRFLAAASHFNLEYAVRINGDNLFADARLIKAIAEDAAENGYDFVSNVPERTFPTGMSIEVLNVAFFKSIINKFTDKKYCEHVTLFIYDHPEVCNRSKFIKNLDLLDARGTNMAIDTVEDLNMASEIIQRLGSRYAVAGWKEIVQLKLQIA